MRSRPRWWAKERRSFLDRAHKRDSVRRRVRHPARACARARAPALAWVCLRACVRRRARLRMRAQRWGSYAADLSPTLLHLIAPYCAIFRLVALYCALLRLFRLVAPYRALLRLVAAMGLMAVDQWPERWRSGQTPPRFVSLIAPYCALLSRLVAACCALLRLVSP